MRLNPSKTLPPSFHQGLRLTSEHDNPWKLPVCEWRLVRHLKLAIHKYYTILKIASSPLHDELLTDGNSRYPSFISGILKCFIWLRHPVSYLTTTGKESGLLRIQKKRFFLVHQWNSKGCWRHNYFLTLTFTNCLFLDLRICIYKTLYLDLDFIRHQI